MKKKQPEQLDMWLDDDLFASNTPEVQPPASAPIDKKEEDQLSFLSTDDLPCALFPTAEQEATLEPVFPPTSPFSSNLFEPQAQPDLQASDDEPVIISESSLSSLPVQQTDLEDKFKCEEIFFNFALLTKEEQKLMRKISRDLCKIDAESISLAEVLKFWPLNPDGQLCAQPIRDVVTRFKQKVRPSDDEQNIEQFLQTHPMLRVAENYFAPSRDKLDNLYFHLAQLTEFECKLVAKVTRELKLQRGSDISVANIIYDWQPPSSQTLILGTPITQVVGIFKEKINRELDQVIDEIEHNIYAFLARKSIFRLTQDVELSAEQVDTILEKDLVIFLANLDDRKKTIISRNFGIDGQTPVTFTDIAPDFDMTRSRVHQIGLDALQILSRSLSITQATIRSTMQSSLNHNIQLYFPKLASHFAREQEFFHFLEIIMDIPKGQLKNIIYPDLNLRFLEDWFLSNPAPMPVATAVELLFEKYGINQQQAINALNCAIADNLFALNDQMLTPRKLGKIEAVIQALLAFPNGANFRKIYEFANQQGFSTHKFVEDRLDHGIACSVDAGWIYLSDRGGYKHINYLPLDEQKIDAVLETIYRYLVDHPDRMTGVNLKFDVYKNLMDLQNIDYFDVRHVIRMHGHKKGIHFYGQSNSDILTLKEE